MASKHYFDRPRWIFFDLDDTLWDFSRNSLISLHHVFDICGEVPSRFCDFDSFVNAYHDANSPLWHRFAMGEITSDFLRAERWRATLFPDSDIDNPPSRCREIDRMYLDTLAQQPHLNPGAREVLSHVAKTAMTAVLSNGFADTQYKKLRNSGLDRLITRLIVSDEIKINKPDSRLFSYAVAATGAAGVPVMVGDSLTNDIEGALNAGWQAVWFNPSDKPMPEEMKASVERAPGFLGSIKTLDEVIPLLGLQAAPEL